MKLELKKADRSFNNESEAKDVYGAIVREGTDEVLCYVPNEKMAQLMKHALEGCYLVSLCDFRGDFGQVLYGENESSARRVKLGITECHKAFHLM